MLNKVLCTVKKHNLLEKGDSILVGLSGGADSVALTHVLHSIKDEMDLTIYTAHLNHGIRGEEAERDESFAMNFSKSLGIKCFVKRVNIRQMSSGVSEELLGRQERYSFFDEICKKEGINKIATAHNKNDNAETILMNFMRGATVKGLSGIPYKRDNIIRPILDISRQEIEEYCKKNNLEYVIDSTNLHEDYTRNKIRLSLMPQIQQEFNPNLINTLTNNAMYFSQDSDFVEQQAQKEYENLVNDNCVSLTQIRKLHPSISRRIVYKMICNLYCGKNDVSSKYTDAVIDLIENGMSGKSLDLGKNIKAKLEYDKLIISKKENITAPFEYTLKLNEEVYVKEADLYIKAEPVEEDGGECFTIPENAVIKVRNRRSRDVFFPRGMTGSKKIKDYFTDEKIPLSIRDKICIVTFDEEIGYIVGKRRDRRFDFKNKGIRIIYRKSPEE